MPDDLSAMSPFQQYVATNDDQDPTEMIFMPHGMASVWRDGHCCTAAIPENVRRVIAPAHHPYESNDGRAAVQQGDQGSQRHGALDHPEQTLGLQSGLPNAVPNLPENFQHLTTSLRPQGTEGHRNGVVLPHWWGWQPLLEGRGSTAHKQFKHGGNIALKLEDENKDGIEGSLPDGQDVGARSVGLKLESRHARGATRHLDWPTTAHDYASQDGDEKDYLPEEATWPGRAPFETLRIPDDVFGVIGDAALDVEILEAYAQCQLHRQTAAELRTKLAAIERWAKRELSVSIADGKMALKEAYARTARRAKARVLMASVSTRLEDGDGRDGLWIQRLEGKIERRERLFRSQRRLVDDS